MGVYVQSLLQRVLLQKMTALVDENASDVKSFTAALHREVGDNLPDDCSVTESATKVQGATFKRSRRASHFYLFCRRRR